MTWYSFPIGILFLHTCKETWLHPAPIRTPWCSPSRRKIAKVAAVTPAAAESPESAHSLAGGGRRSAAWVGELTETLACRRRLRRCREAGETPPTRSRRSSRCRRRRRHQRAPPELDEGRRADRGRRQREEEGRRRR